MATRTQTYDIDIADLEYLRHGDTPLLLRLFKPKGDGPFPIMLELHGGAWVRGDRLNGNAANEAMAKNGEYLAKLVNEHGVKVRAFSDEVWDSFGEASAEVFEEVRDHSALAKKIDDAFQKALREIGGCKAQFEGTFLAQRNRVLGLS